MKQRVILGVLVFITLALLAAVGVYSDRRQTAVKSANATKTAIDEQATMTVVAPTKTAIAVATATWLEESEKQRKLQPLQATATEVTRKSKASKGPTPAPKKKSEWPNCSFLLASFEYTMDQTGGNPGETLKRLQDALRYADYGSYSQEQIKQRILDCDKKAR